MKWKKITSYLLAAVMIVSLTACGESKETPSDSYEESVEYYEESEKLEEDADIAEQDTEEEPEVEEAREEEQEFKTTATIEETVLVDENDVKITATDISYSQYSVELNLVLENNSDKDLSIVSGSMGYSCNAINGYMVSDGYMLAEIAAGKKANETVKFDINTMMLYGITEVADIQIGFKISDDDYNSFYSGPRQVKTSLADSYDYATDTYQEAINSGILEAVYDCTIDYYAQEELYNQNDLSIVSEVLMTNANGEKMVLLEVINNSSEIVCGVASDIFVNGLGVYSGAWTSETINPGTRCVMDFSITSLLDSAYWDVLGIGEIEELKCSFSIKDKDYNDILEGQEVRASFSDNATGVDTAGTELCNENGVRIISKGITEDSTDYTDNLHMLLLVENTSTDIIRLDDVYDSFSANGFMTDCMVTAIRIAPGEMALVDVEIQDSSLEENNITGIADITETEIAFEIKNDGYKTIGEVKVSCSY